MSDCLPLRNKKDARFAKILPSMRPNSFCSSFCIAWIAGFSSASPHVTSLKPCRISMLSMLLPAERLMDRNCSLAGRRPRCSFCSLVFNSCMLCWWRSVSSDKASVKCWCTKQTQITQLSNPSTTRQIYSEWMETSTANNENRGVAPNLIMKSPRFLLLPICLGLQPLSMLRGYTPNPEDFQQTLNKNVCVDFEKVGVVCSE